jgi:hypothetical protein
MKTKTKKSARKNTNLRPPLPGRALVVRKPWIDLILAGEKTWEIRGSNTAVRGRVGLIESGTGTVVGECDIVASIPQNTPSLIRHCLKHRISRGDCYNVRYASPHAWVLENAVRYETPVPYDHPQGAVIWVKLGGDE